MWEATFFFEATFYPWGRGVILVKSFLFTNRSCVASALGQCFHSVSQTFLLIIFQHQERYTSSSYLMEEEWESVDNPTKSFNPTGGKMRPEKREKVRNGRGGAGGGVRGKDNPGSVSHWVLVSRICLDRCLLNRFHQLHQFLSFRMGRGTLFLLRVSLGELELWGLCPDAQPTSPEMQALSGHTPLETAIRPPSLWCPWKHLWCLLLWGWVPRSSKYAESDCPYRLRRCEAPAEQYLDPVL